VPENPLEQTETALVIANVKSVAEQPAMLSNLMFSNLVNNTNLGQQNTLANQQAMNQVGRSVVGKVVNAVLNLGPLEAMSSLQLLTGNSVAEEKLDLAAAGSDPRPPHPPHPHEPGRVLHWYNPGGSMRTAVRAGTTFYAYSSGTAVVIDPKTQETTTINFTEKP
jgi:hypothetical protein